MCSSENLANALGPSTGPKAGHGTGVDTKLKYSGVEGPMIEDGIHTGDG